MSWEDRYETGRFRDAEFVTRSHDHEGGRRVVVHQYPHRDIPYPEDMGRQAGQFSLDLFIVGPEYMAGRDRLLAALKEHGPGTLIHPYLGTMQVQVQTYRLRESTRDGGMATFSVQFVEAGENRFPRAGLDTRSRVRSASGSALESVLEDFRREYSTEGQPEWVVERAEGIAGDLLGQLQRLAGRNTQVGQPLTDYVRDLNRGSANLSAVIRQPAALGNLLSSQISGLSSIYATPMTAFSSLRTLFSFGAGLLPVSPATPARRQQRRNQQALTGLTQQAAVIEAARQSADIQFESFDDAAAVREELTAELDRHSLTAADAVYPALQHLRAQVSRDITTRGADLARIVQFTPQATLPSLVVAHQLYGDARQERAILDRNRRRVRHPGFVPGGQALEVLTDV